MSDDEILEIVQAHIQGKKIEYREIYLREHGRWIPADTPDLWDFRNRRYRVAPEPRKPREWDVYEISNCITSFEPMKPHSWKSIRVREVLENE